MTLPRKHSHQIVVDQVTYRWCLGKRRYQHGLGLGDRIVVEAAEFQGAPLIVSLHPFWCDHPSLTPRHVAGWIKEALAGGWTPLQAGRPFDLTGGTPAGDDGIEEPMPR